MKVTRKFIFRFLQSEYESYKQCAQKFARLMSSAEQVQDVRDYRNAEFNWMRCEHSAQAIQLLINRLKSTIEEGDRS